MKIRSFLAFDIPKDVRQKLAKLINDFAAKETGVRWLDPETLHVTMKFFGDVDEELLLGDISRDIEEVTSKTIPFSLDCTGLGVFPNWKYPQIIWAGFLGDSEPVLNLKDALDSSLAKYALKKDARAFRLHLTIGRAKEIKGSGKLATLISGLGPISFGRVSVKGLTLYKSVLTKTGSIYTPLKEFKFTENK